MSTTKQDIALMKKDIESLTQEVKEINEKIDNLTLKLLDPDDGVVSRVNKNTAFRKSHDESMPYYMEAIDELNEIKRWKNNVSKALWVVFTALIGVIVKLLFW
jgi:predicted  nucleic acid-binding Zn-ribbon protein